MTAEGRGGGVPWSSCRSGSAPALALAMRAMLDDPATGVLTIHVSAQGIRYVRLRETAADPVVGWPSLS